MNSPKSKKSGISTNARSTNRITREPRIESQELLDFNLQEMKSFDYDKFEEATIYINKLLANIKDQSVIYFLSQNSSKIIQTYTDVINGVMPQSINYNLDQDNYATMFGPLITLVNNNQIINSVIPEVLTFFIQCIVDKLVSSNQDKEQTDIYLKQMYNEEIEMQKIVATYVTKSLNSIMLKVINKSDPNLIVKTLFDIIFNCRSNNLWPEKKLMKTTSLAAKCILRCIQKVEGNMELISLEELFYGIVVYSQNFNETKEDSNIWKIFRNLINDVVKSFEISKVWSSYNETCQGFNDQFLSRAINAAEANLKKSLIESYYSQSQNNLNVKDKSAIQTSGMFNTSYGAGNFISPE